MAGYNEIRGLRVKYLSADPAGAEDGQVWYNSTTGNLRVEGIQGAGTWASGANYPTTFVSGSGGGNISAGWVTAGGSNTATFKYDGSSWTSTGALNTWRAGAGSAGSQTAGLIFAGSTSPAPSPSGRNNITEEFNGSSWSEQNDMAQTRDSLAGCGTQTAALGAAGFVSGPYASGSTQVVEEYDGTNWTSATSVPGSSGKAGLTAAGTQTAAIATGGGPSNTNVSNEYDGTNWTSAPNYPTPAAAMACGGTQNDAIFNGNGGTGTTTASYNGTTWTAQNSNAQGRHATAYMGQGAAEVTMSGGTPGSISATEEFTIPVGTVNITTS
jgi:hypothetical protein|tara:strand:+ start:278 stop:1255 length:978 start_codon:yes stop_codon:yes gene_type:complete